MVKSIFCSICDLSVPSKSFSAHLKRLVHKNNSIISESEGVEKVSSAFRSRIASYRVLCGEDAGPSDSAKAEEQRALPPADFLMRLRKRVRALISARIQVHTSIKVNFELFSEFLLLKNDSLSTKSFATENIIFHPDYNYEAIFSQIVESIKNKIDKFEERDSGWSFARNLYLEININKYDPLRASSYIDLPKTIKNKGACINIRNNDNFCFLWCIMAALFPAKNNSQRTSAYPHFNTLLNIKNMTFPVAFSDVKIFEKNNPRISVNIYGLNSNSKVVGPLYRSVCRKKHHINLLFIQSGARSHYCLIKNLTKLVRQQLTKHHAKVYFCEDCMIFFDNTTKLNSHVCSGVRTVLPDEGTLIQFTHYERMHDIPFVIYADFESLLQPTSGESGLGTSSSSTLLHHHVPSAFAYYIVCSFDSSLNKYVCHRGSDCVEKFLENLQRDVAQIHEKINSPIPMTLTEEDKQNFSKSKVCFICEKALFDDKVRDHCHLTGRYRGAAHSYCNIRFKLPKFIPVFFHNLSGYDSHLFIRHLGETEGRIKVIAKNKENYISFTKFFEVTASEFIAVRFVDSFKFLDASLEKLVESLDVENFTHLPKFFPRKYFSLLRRKGVYPYEYMCSWSTYEENKLPPKNCFYNRLTASQISDSDYIHAQDVWNAFQMKSLGEYTDLYLKTDVLLLADVFENFRKTCKLHYRLDPAFYLTAPSLSWDAMLLKTGIKLELINNLEIIRMIQNGIRGGICLCPRRYSKANNKYVNDYNPGEPENYLVYLDCVNLYGHAMCAYLPYSDFKLLNEPEIAQIDFGSVPLDGDYGYIMEVDLAYPECLHELHNDIPFCAQNYSPPGSMTSKLIPNLHDKYHYVIHFVHLRTCLKHGLILKKIHRVIQFRQSPFLKQYIDLNTELRKKAKCTFEQDFFKRLNNSTFGKTLEDNEKKVDVRLINKWCEHGNKTKKVVTAERLISRPNFLSASIFSENLVAIQMKPETITLDKPIYIGFSVLEISKSHMYDFHYSVMKPYYDEKIKLCYTDTDSLLYSIETHDFYKDLKSNFLSYFDTSNYTGSNLYGIPKLNKKVPGLFKDELGGQIITEFVGLRSKLYCVKTVREELKKAKGVQKREIKNLHLKDYHNVLMRNEIIRKKNVIFKSIKHEIFTQEQSKIALSANDDKRVLLKNRISTLAWGHRDSIF